MSLELILRPEAEADALEAYRWYSEQLPGLGEDLLAEIDHALENIRANPEAFQKVHRAFSFRSSASIANLIQTEPGISRARDESVAV